MVALNGNIPLTFPAGSSALRANAGGEHPEKGAGAAVLSPSVRAALGAGCSAVQNTPLFTIAYGSVTVNGAPAAAGTVVEARSPAGTPVGCFVVASAGSYGAMYIYGADGSVNPPVPGMQQGEGVSFFVNGSAATPSPALVWANDRDLHRIDLTAAAPTPSISVSPADSPVGSPVSVRGDRFTAGQAVELRLDSAAGTLLSTVTAGTDGSFTTNPGIPAGTPLGQHLVVATVGGSSQAEARFTLTMLLDLLPSGATVRVGEIVSIEVRVHSGPQLLHGVQAYLAFDAAALEVQDADASTPGTQSIRGDCGFTSVLQNEADNVAGTLAISLGVDSAAPQTVRGDCTLATIRFRAKAQRLDGTPVSFSLTPPFPITGATFEGQVIPLSASTASLQLLGKRLVFIAQPAKGASGFALGIQPVVQLQDGLGRPWPDSGTSVTLRIKAGSGTAGATLACPGGLSSTTTMGQATFAGCTIDLKGTGYQLEATAPDIPTAAQTGAFEVIWAGDANGDCLVDIIDFSVLAGGFGRRLGAAGFVSRADLNGDNLVDILDFSVLVTMFGTRCPALGLGPAIGGAGTEVTVTGSAYVPNREVLITFDGEMVVTTPLVVTADGSGSFTARFDVPAAAAGGQHVVKASQLSGRVVVPAMFVVP